MVKWAEHTGEPGCLARAASQVLLSKVPTGETEPLENNVFNTALLFEGGSMRAAYTCAVAEYLLKQGVYFNTVYGVSAGSSNTVNYFSRDIDRTRLSFTDFMDDPKVGSWRTFLQGKGLFSAQYIYQETGVPGGPFPLDFATFQRNPGNVRIMSFDRDTGQDLVFTNETMHSAYDALSCVRASSTLPIMMPPPTVQGHVCYDGGFADGGGLPVRTIMAEGFDRMVIVRTRKRGYRKSGTMSWAKAYFWKYPKMRDAVLTRNERYNQACDLIDQLERDGRAYVFYCDDLTLSGNERDVDLFRRNYEMGAAQIERDFGAMMRFIELGE